MTPKASQAIWVWCRPLRPRIPAVEPKMHTAPAPPRTSAVNRVTQSKLASFLCTGYQRRLRGRSRRHRGGNEPRQAIAIEVDLENVVNDRGGDRPAVASMLHEHGERDHGVLPGSIADEPRVVAHRLGKLVAVHACGSLEDLHRAGLTHDIDV